MYTTYFAKICARRMRNDYVPPGNVMFVSILCFELSSTFEIWYNIAMYVPTRIRFSLTFLDIAWKGIEAKFAKGVALCLRFFAGYQNIDFWRCHFAVFFVCERAPERAYGWENWLKVPCGCRFWEILIGNPTARLLSRLFIGSLSEDRWFHL